MRRGALLALAGSVLAVAAAYALAFLPGARSALAPVLLAVGTGGVLAAVLALAVERNGRLGALWVPVLFVALVVGAGLGALVLLPAADPADPRLVLGLPPRAAFLLYGVGLLPTLVVPVAYALTFERLTLRPEDLERVRRAAEARRAGKRRGPAEGGPAGEGPARAGPEGRGAAASGPDGDP